MNAPRYHVIQPGIYHVPATRTAPEIGGCIHQQEIKADQDRGLYWWASGPHWGYRSAIIAAFEIIDQAGTSRWDAVIFDRDGKGGLLPAQYAGRPTASLDAAARQAYRYLKARDKRNVTP